jgi:hypothetical protein
MEQRHRHVLREKSKLQAGEMKFLMGIVGKNQVEMEAETHTLRESKI